MSSFAMEVVDGGAIDGVVISNISMNDVHAAFFIHLGDMGRVFVDDTVKRGVGIIRNIIVNNVIANIVDEQNPYCSSITGMIGKYIENITLSNIKIISNIVYGKEKRIMRIDEVPDNPQKYPEYSMFGPLPAYGFFCRHVNGLSFNNLDLRFYKTDYRSAMVFDNIRNMDINGFKAQTMIDSRAVILMNNVESGVINGAIAQKDTNVFLDAQGGGKYINLNANELSKAKIPYVIKSGGGNSLKLQAPNKIK
jgi:hypothetical protein